MPIVQAMTTFVSSVGRGVEAGNVEYVVRHQGTE